MLLRGFDLGHIFATLAYVLVLLLVRRITEKIIRNKAGEQWSQEHRLKKIGHLRSTILGLIVFGVIFIWAEEIRSFTVSVFAVAVAFVMALKELITCIHGYLILMTSSCYALGDRIEIGHFKGDVIGINLLFTTLLEVDSKTGYQGTGKIVFFPNCLLLTSTVVNSSMLEDFSFVLIKIPMMANDNWIRARSILIEIAQEECNPFADKARRRARSMAQKHGVEAVSVEPRVFVTFASPGKLFLTLRLSTPSHLKDCVEQSITSRFLEKFLKEDKLSAG